MHRWQSTGKPLIKATAGPTSAFGETARYDCKIKSVPASLNVRSLIDHE